METDFLIFLKHYATLPSRTFIVTVLAKTLFTNITIFQEFGMQTEFQNLLNAMFENILLRKTNFRQLTRSFKLKKFEKETLNKESNQSYTNMKCLNALQFSFNSWLNQFIN